MGGNPGENLTLVVLYIFIVGLAGVVIAVVRIKILEYLAKKKSKGTNDEKPDNTK